MIKNTSQNRSQNHQKSIKNRSKIGPFWEILPSFGRFGRPKGCCGGPRATRKGSGRHRVRSGPAREAILVPTWPQHGPILGAKIEQKSVGRRCEKVSIFGWPSGSNLERFWEGFGSENGPMLAPKIDPKMDVILEGPIPQITHET